MQNAEKEYVRKVETSNSHSLTFKLDGCVVTYIGQVNEAGQAHGKGTAKWQHRGNEYHYRGCFVNDCFEGIGVYTNPLSYQEGEFVNGEFHEMLTNVHEGNPLVNRDYRNSLLINNRKVNDSSEAYYIKGKPQKSVFAPLRYRLSLYDLKIGALIVNKAGEIGMVTNVNKIHQCKGGRHKFVYEYMQIDSGTVYEDMVYQQDNICVPVLTFVEYLCLWVEDDGSLELITTDTGHKIEGFELPQRVDVAGKIKEICEKCEYECIVQTYIWNEKKQVRSVREGECLI